MKQVGLFYGGFSSEFEISYKSALTIKTHFPANYLIHLIEVNKEGFYLHTEDGLKIAFSLDSMSAKKDATVYKIDVALIYIHGTPGEDGKLQAIFDLKNIPYINSGTLSSSLSFDKWYCNQFLSRFSIPVAKSIFLTKTSKYNEQEIIEHIGLPCFVKPTDSGSSFGISKVNSISTLKPAIENAFKEGKTVVIESYLDGKEVTCGVYRTINGIVTLPKTEIVSENEFFDYEAKYLGKSNEITPARITESESEYISKLAIECYELLQLKSIARIDFMLVKGVPHVIEVNTTPGFSPASIVPQMLEVAGKSITEFWNEIIEVELK